MAHVFGFHRKSNGERVLPVNADTELREALGEPPHDDEWLYNWYNAMGPMMALTGSYEKLRELWGDDPRAMRVIQWFEDNYDLSNWRD